MKAARSLLSRTPWIIVILLGISPLLFLTATQDYYDLTKWMALAIIGLLISLLWAAQLLKKHHPVEITIHPGALGFGAIAVVSLISFLFISTNKVEALLSFYGPVTWVSLTLFFLLGYQFIPVGMRTHIRHILYASIAILMLIAIYQALGIGKLMFPGVAFLADNLWTPTGSSVTTVVVCFLVLPLMIEDAYHAMRRKEETPMAMISIATFVTVAGLIVTLWQIIPKLGGSALSPLDGWTIAFNVLKNPGHALFGIGAENFISAFTAGRPQSMNLTPLWNIRFATNASLFFHLLSIYGILGGLACAYLLKQFVVKTATLGHRISLAATGIALLLTPPTMTLILVTAIILLLLLEGKPITVHLPTKLNRMRFALFGVIVLVVAIFGYGLVRSYDAELTFYQSLTAAQANKGTDAYNAAVAAVQKNYAISRFHITLSQTELAVAGTLVQNINKQPTDAKSATSATTDKNLAAQLIQQSIRDAKLATTMKPDDILAWENLARIYSRLGSIAQNASAWSDAAYQKAIELDPTNPLLHQELATLYTQNKNYTLAITQLQQAVNLKPNYANGYYNLANVYKLSGDLSAATKAMQQTLNLVSPTSSDYQVVKSQLDQLNTQSPQVTPTKQ